MPSIVYIELRDNPGYHYADVLSAINYNFQLVSGGTGGGNTGTTNVQPGTNITTGGTALTPIVSVVASPSFSNLTFSGTGQFAATRSTTFSGGTVSGGTIYSGTTNLSTTIINVAAATGDFTRVRPGSNISTGGTSNSPIISTVASPSFNSLTLSGALDTAYISRIGTNQLIFRETNTSAVHGDITYSTAANLGVFRWYGDSSFVSLSAATFSGGTLYSGSTPLQTIFNSIISGSSSSYVLPTYVAYGSSNSGITYNSGLTYNAESATASTVDGFRISSTSSGTHFQIWQANRQADFASAFTVSTTESGSNGGTNVTINSRVNDATLNLYANGVGLGLSTSIDAGNGIGTSTSDLVVAPGSGVFRPNTAGVSLGSAARGWTTLHMSTGIIQQLASMSSIFTLNLGGTRDDGLANKSAFVIRGASAYTTTHYLSIADNQSNVFWTVAPSGNTGIGLGGSTDTPITPTAKLDISGSSASRAALRIRSGSTSVTSPNDGDIWNEGTHLFGRFGGTTRVLDASGDTMTSTYVTYGSPTNVITGSTGFTFSAGSATITKQGDGVLTVIGSGTSQPIFTVQGSQGELFSVTDSLSGSLFSVNDISGLPILEVFSDNTMLMGDYLAPALYTTTKTSLSSGTNSIYAIPTSAYTGAFVDYTVLQNGGARAGTMMMVWSGVTANFTDTVTNDIGTTTSVSMSANVVGNYAVLLCSASTSGFVLKTIIRSI